MNNPDNAPCFVLINPAAGGGRGMQRWRRLEPHLTAMTGELIKTELDPPGAWEKDLKKAINGGLRTFIAAGGDGTVRALVDAIVRINTKQSLESFTIGAAGTGSSNDFHKPFRRMIEEIPVKFGRRKEMRDICRAAFISGENQFPSVKYFMSSASIGFVAEANAFFQNGGKLQQQFKKNRIKAAILYAFLRTLFHYQNIEGLIYSNHENSRIRSVTNLSIAKTRWVSGDFRYDTPAEADDGLLAVNLCENMTRYEIVKVMLDLGQGRFLGLPRRHFWQENTLNVELNEPVTLELDGEVFRTSKVSFDVLKQKIGVYM